MFFFVWQLKTGFTVGFHWLELFYAILKEINKKSSQNSFLVIIVVEPLSQLSVLIIKIFSRNLF